MKNKLIRIIKAAIFVILLALIIIVASIYLTPYWRYSNDPDDAGESARYENFYEMPENTLDYLVIGPSNSYHSLEPMQVYAYSGITGFDLGGPSQPMYCSYYWLKEALKTQSPKVVFVDTGAFVRETPNNERILKAILPMKPSMLKLQAIKDCCGYDNDLLYTALFPLYQFHSRWKELSKKDIERKNTEPYLTKGATIRFVSQNGIEADEINLREEKNVTVSSDGTVSTAVDEMPLNEDSAYWLGKMKELCEENGIEIVPIKFPTKNWNQRWSDKVQKYLDEIGLELVDLTGEENPAGINWDKDSFDNGKHLNYYGMVKTSKYFAGYLSKNWDFESHKGQSGYELWDNDLEEYRTWETDEITELFEKNREKYDYFNGLAADKENYLVLMCVKTDVSKYWPVNLDGVMEEFGVKTDLSEIYQQSYIAVSDGGKLLMEVSDPDIINYDFEWKDDRNTSHSIHIKSGGVGGEADIDVDDNSYAPGNAGLNIVVINKKDGSFVTAASLGSDDEELAFEADAVDDPAVVLDAGDYTFKNGNSSFAVELKINEDGSYLVVDKKTGKCLSAAGLNKPGDKVSEEEDLGLAATKWRIYHGRNGKYWLYSVFNGMTARLKDGGFVLEDLNEYSEIPQVDIN
ncbi:MAG: RICIN domain-containing protein [Lachnospiraceae bacterium]|nr:RICIN domain-containing protein [Lachnospiraceae bacterium]